MNFQELKEFALTNPHGKIVSRGAKGNDIDNCGAWDRTDASIDIIEDIMNGLRKLNNIPRLILMHPNTYSNLICDIGFEKLYQIGAIFGCDHHDRSWLDVKDEYNNNEVLIIAKSQNVTAIGPDPLIVHIDTT